MKAFPVPLTSRVAPLLRDNVDTDAIIPSREMRSTGKTGLADGLFAPWRYIDADARTPNLDFVLNDPEFANSAILAGGKNFGCGSSREHAVWALAEYGICCVIAESFAPIFRGNCARNGILPVALERAAIETIAGNSATIDLQAQTVASGTESWSFEIGEEARTMLLEGLDAIDLTFKHQTQIAAWQAADRQARPYIYLNPSHDNGEGDHAQHGGGVHYKLPQKTNPAVMRARAMRRSMPPSETRLWNELRKRPDGFKFRRQHPAGDYVMDFFCPAAGLCIEVDGEAHDRAGRPARDAERDAFLEKCDVVTLRIPAKEVFQNLQGVVDMIVDAAQARLPLHQPSAGPPPQHVGEDR